MDRHANLTAACLASACVLVSSACTFKGEPAEGMGANRRGEGPVEGGAEAPPGEVWKPRPTAMRIYPSTRFVRDPESAVLQARIELFDQMGDSIKSSGVVQFELHAAGRAGVDRVGQVLYQWRIPLRTLSNQRQFYDPIFRGYEFRLRIDDERVARRPTILQATFNPSRGERMTTQSRVKADW